MSGPNQNLSNSGTVGQNAMKSVDFNRQIPVKLLADNGPLTVMVTVQECLRLVFVAVSTLNSCKCKRRLRRVYMRVSE